MKALDRHVAERSTRVVTASFAHNAEMALTVLNMFLLAVLAEHKAVMGSPTRTKTPVQIPFS